MEALVTSIIDPAPYLISDGSRLLSPLGRIRIHEPGRRIIEHDLDPVEVQCVHGLLYLRSNRFFSDRNQDEPLSMTVLVPMVPVGLRGLRRRLLSLQGLDKKRQCSGEAARLRRQLAF